MENEDLNLVVNGINGSTGTYLIDEMTVDEFINCALDLPISEDERSALKNRHNRENGAFLGTIEGVDPEKIEEAGWGIIFADEDKEMVPAILEKLKPLLDHRKEQASKIKDRYREYTGEKAYQKGQHAFQFLSANGAHPGDAANPDKIPYYLLIVGDPEVIPFEFQYHLDLEYAVGRIHFEDLDDYARYAENVVKHEKSQTLHAKTACFWGPENPDDTATKLSTKYLIAPLREKLSSIYGNWEFNNYAGETATKEKLAGIMKSERPPALLFTASHGMAFSPDDDAQFRHTGALICQDWPGKKKWKGSLLPDHYFGGEDLDGEMNVDGMIAFMFACYGAGIPKFDSFAQKTPGERRQIAKKNMLSPLPLKLLSQENGGALAVVGHVDRAWAYSFAWPDIGQQTDTIESVIKRILDGKPIGMAVEYLDSRNGTLATQASALEKMVKAGFGGEEDKKMLSSMLTARYDAESFVIIGDPAVRLRV